MPLVYVVDDEPSIRRLVSIALKDEGFETRDFSDGNSLMTDILKKVPDVIVLDWMMPEMDGIAVRKMIRDNRELRHIPILMLTAKSGELDKILGLELGADDYMTKPFSIKELAARVRALIRRKEYMMSSTKEASIHISNIDINTDSREVKVEGQTIPFTVKEFDLLVVLVENKGKVLTRDMLLDKVWGISFYGDARTVDVHISFLRQKIEADPANPKFIQTVRGVGYRFSDENN